MDDSCIRQRWWRHRASGEEVSALGGFTVLYADPPWAYRVEGGRGAADKHYGTMKLGELCMLPIEELAAPDAVLFMWATWPTLPDAFGLMRAWGFEFKTCAFSWHKVNKIATDTSFVGLGHWTRANSEPCLLGIRGKPQRVSKAVQQVISAPIGEHSAKPAETRTRILELMGDVPAIELFAREPSPGFECWGNEVNASVTLEYR